MNDLYPTLFNLKIFLFRASIAIAPLAFFYNNRAASAVSSNRIKVNESVSIF